MSYYKHHVFVCCNQRQRGKACNNDGQSQRLRDYAKDKIRSLGLAGPAKVRINQAGCLDRCKDGPVLVIYPEETWYTYYSQEDIDEIIDEHLNGGRPVERLRLR